MKQCRRAADEEVAGVEGDLLRGSACGEAEIQQSEEQEAESIHRFVLSRKLFAVRIDTSRMRRHVPRFDAVVPIAERPW